MAAAELKVRSGESEQREVVEVPTSLERQPAQQEQEGQKGTAIPSNEDSTLANGWKRWKTRSGSAQNTNRRVSSIDPLFTPNGNSNDGQPSLQEPTIHEENEPDHLVPTVHPNQTSAPSTNSSWLSYLNPLSYAPQDLLRLPPLPLPQQQTPRLDTQSTHSSTDSTIHTQTHQVGWFKWFLNPIQYSEDIEVPHDSIGTAELKKNIKEAKKAINSPDSIWAWYQSYHHDEHVKVGEISVLSTKSETSPVELPKYPHTSTTTTSNNDQPSKSMNSEPIPNHNSGTGEVIPKFNETFRTITKKTKVRLATELYYNFPSEKHLYIKKSIKRPSIQNILIISITSGSSGSSKSKNNDITANDLSIIANESVKSWVGKNNGLLNGNGFQTETISLEVGKISDLTVEDLFKLLINWRESFKKIDHLFIIGLQKTVPLTFALLDVLISRNLFVKCHKFGMLSIDGVIPGPYLSSDQSNSLNLAYLRNGIDEFDQIFNSLINEKNVKLTLLGTFNDLSISLALQYHHPNIFRNVYLPKNSYNDSFEKQLFKLLLTSQNLGVSATRLLIQSSKYFSFTGNGTQLNLHDDLNKDFILNSIDFSLKTTSLLSSKPIRKEFINDPILNNEFNLIWTFHAFINDYKKIKNIQAIENIQLLLKHYKSWDPTVRNLKELKYMLEVLQIDDYSGTIFQ